MCVPSSKNLRARKGVPTSGNQWKKNGPGVPYMLTLGCSLTKTNLRPFTSTPDSIPRTPLISTTMCEETPWPVAFLMQCTAGAGETPFVRGPAGPAGGQNPGVGGKAGVYSWGADAYNLAFEPVESRQMHSMLI